MQSAASPPRVIAASPPRGNRRAVAAITAYIALISSGGVTAEMLASMRKLYSGGAPIAPATIAAFEAKV